MEKILKLYTYIDGINDTPFPSEEHQVVTSNFRGDYKRMGGAPSITCTIMHPMCLDKLWTYGVYAKFNGERFFIKQIPSSSYDNTDARYKHELELVSERIILDNVYVYDVVDSVSADDKPVSNNSKFTFFGTVNEFAQRLNQSLRYSGLDYTIVVDDGITSDGKLVSFENQFFTNALQEIYNIFELPYYFVGKVIHIGYTSNAITHTFKYGQDESLLSIQKQNANHKIVNRVTGVGSADNIPYYYPNDYESKEVVEANGGVWINPQSKLMPSIYRETLGKERFYNALDDTYVNPEIDEYYKFENQYIKGQPREHIVNFENVKPSIVGVKNASNQRIDMFLEFAYDENDNDEFDDEGNYLHPYFFAKLRKFDGEYGFNLFDHAIDEDEMVISMTSGSCGSCEFIIGVDDETQKNIVQVDEYGNLKRDDKGNVKFGTPQDNQNDTINNEVWIALKKDINTFGVIMPNAEYKYRPSTNDTFVILHIDLPKAYILAAENNLKEQLIKYMAVNNVEKFNFSISFSRIFFAENPHILAQLDENARIQIEYDGIRHDLYVSSYSYNMSSDKSLPEIKVELSDTISVQQNALQNAISEVKQDIMSSVGSVDFLKQGLRYFLRKDTSDRTRGKLSSDVGFEVGKFVSGASGAIIQIDKNTGHTIAEIDKLYVRMKAYFETLEIISTNSIGGKMILSPAGSVKCIGVEEKGNAYRCYFLGEQDGEIIENRWEVGMQAYSQMFNAKVGVSNNVSNTYYWRLVTEKSENIVDFSNQKCHYIDLSKTDCDSGSDIPKAGDVINHRGSRNNVDYMNFIEFSSVGTNAPYITLFQGVNSYSLANKEYVSFGYDQSTGRSYMNVYGNMYVGDRNKTSYMRYTQDGGLEIKGKLSVGTKLGDKDLKELIDNAAPEGYKEFVEKVTQDIDNLQNQVDGAIDSYFYDYDPTLDNYPTVTWTTDSDKESHLGDTFTNNKSGDSWRWGLVDGNYQWIYIEDTATKKALSTASKAQDTADGKRRVFVGVSAPSVPYDKGDLWSRGSDYTLLVCDVSKTSSQSYSESDWGYADNTEKLNEEMKTLVNNTKSELEQSVLDAESAMKDYSDEAKEELQKNIDAVNSAKANVADVYDKATVDGIVDKAEAQAISKANEVAQAERELLETRVKAYADGEIDDAEQEAINEAQKRVDAAKAELEEAMSLMDSELRSLVTTTKGELNNAIVQATEAANSYADKGIAGAKQALEKSIDDLNKAKANVSDVYSKAEADGVINQAEADAIKAADDAAKAAIALADEQIRAYADGIVDDEEAARIKQAQENLQAAKDYADQKAQEAFNVIAGFEYLKEALGKSTSTEINNGLVLTSLIQLRDKDSNVMSGINGIVTDAKKEKSIATWWGGDMNDLTDYYTWQNGEWKPKSGVTIPTSIPSGLIRFDGTGYLAKGKFWWDNDGRIYADPRALFLMFDVEDEAKSLSSTILAMLDKQTEFADMWAVKTDKNGNKYLYSKYDLVTQGGISMYSDATTLDVLNIYNGLPIDGATIYWENGVLKALNDGGVASSVAWDNITGKPNFASVATSGKYDDLIGKPTLLSSFTDDIVSGKYLPLTGGTLNGALTIKNGKDTKMIFNNTDGEYYTMILFQEQGKTYSTIVCSSTYLDLQHKKLTFNQNLVYHKGILDTLKTDLGLGSNAYTSTEFLPSASYTASDVLAKLKAVDGTGSGLDADLLDGKQPSELNVGSANRINLVFNDEPYTVDLNTALKGGGILRDYYGGLHRHTNGIESASFGSIIEFSANGKNASLSAQMAWDINRNGQDATKALYWRASYDVNWTNSKWHQIAFTDSNVASATKLETPRTIWGQPFDGTGNIDGTLSAICTKDKFSLHYQVYYTGGQFLASDLSNGEHLGISFGKEYSSKKMGYIRYDRGTDDENSYMSLGLHSVDECLTIKTNGNVGIGTNSPLYKLSVNGTLNATTIYQNGITLDDTYLRSSDYTASDVLAKMLTVDGSNSGLDADLLDGKHYENIVKDTLMYNRKRTDINKQGWYRIASISLYGSFMLSITGSYTNTCSTPATFIINKTYDKVSISQIGKAPDADMIRKIRVTHNDDKVTIKYIEVYFLRSFSDTQALVYKIVPLITRDGDLSPITMQDATLVSDDLSPDAEINVLTDADVYSSHKLSTPRTIWGQSFDGTGNVSGHLNLGYFNITNAHGSIVESSSSNVIFGKGNAVSGFPTYLDGYELYLRYGKSNNIGMKITDLGNILIGTTADSGYKLDVNGGVRFGNGSSCDIWLNRSDYRSYIHALHSLSFRVKDETSALTLNEDGSSTVHGALKISDIPIYKSRGGVLYIEGNLAVKGGVTMYATDAIDIPSIIDSLPIAGYTTDAKGIAAFNPSDFVINDGVVSYIGKSSGVDEAFLSSYLVTNNYAKKSDIPSYSAGSGLELKSNTFSANGSAIINALGVGLDAATREDYIVAQYAGGGTTSTTYHRRKLAKLFAALNSSDITTALGFTPYNSSNPNGYITSSALSGYATESYVTGRGYITASALNGYATESYVTSRGYITSSALNGYATSSWVSSNFLSLSGGTITGDLTVNNTIYSNAFRSRYNRWMMGDDGSTMQTFGGNYNGSSTVINGNKVKIWANDVEVADIDSGGVTFRKRTWCTESSVALYFQSLTACATGANTTGAFRMGQFDESDGGFKMQFGGTSTNGHFQIIDQSWSKSLFGVDKSGNGDFWGYLTCRGTMNISGVSGVNTSINLYSYDNSGYQFSNRVTDGKMLRIYYRSSSGQFTNVMELGTTGNLLVMGGITMYGTSDKRLKKNIRTFSASEELMKLGGVYEFEYNDDEIKRNEKYKGTHFGLIYQNVKQTSLAKMCYEREDGYGALNYIDTSFISLLAGVGMEHETRIQKLERENKELKKELEYVRRELESN